MVQAVCAIEALVKECGIAPRRMPQNLAGMDRRASPELGGLGELGVLACWFVAFLLFPHSLSLTHSPTRPPLDIQPIRSVS